MTTSASPTVVDGFDRLAVTMLAPGYTGARAHRVPVDNTGASFGPLSHVVAAARSAWQDGESLGLSEPLALVMRKVEPPALVVRSRRRWSRRRT